MRRLFGWVSVIGGAVVFLLNAIGNIQTAWSLFQGRKEGLRAVQTLPWSQWAGLGVFLAGVALLIWSHRRRKATNQIKWLSAKTRDRIRQYSMILVILIGVGIGAIIGGTLAGVGYWLIKASPTDQPSEHIVNRLESPSAPTPVAPVIEHRKDLVVVPLPSKSPSSAKAGTARCR